ECLRETSDAATDIDRRFADGINSVFRENRIDQQCRAFATECEEFFGIVIPQLGLDVKERVTICTLIPGLLHILGLRQYRLQCPYRTEELAVNPKLSGRASNRSRFGVIGI